MPILGQVNFCPIIIALITYIHISYTKWNVYCRANTFLSHNNCSSYIQILSTKCNVYCGTNYFLSYITPTVYTFHILKFHIIIYSYFIVPYYISCTKYNDCCGTKMVFMCSIIVALFAYTFHPQSLAVVLGHRHYFLSSEQNSKFS